MTNVSKVYSNGAVALTGVNIDVPRGDFVFVVGPSGAGKSTFIKLIFREIAPTTGSIIVSGKNIENILEHDVPYLRRSLGIVFQDFRLLQNKTAYENIAFALEVIEAPKREIQKKVPAVLDLVGLWNKSKVYPNQLSGGEQQRVAIARAIVNNPVLVIADEPTGNLDPDTSWEIMRIFEHINKTGTTIIMATHAKAIVNSMKKRVIAIEQGHVVRDELKGAYGYED
jgi:cell division transport system ATP-binding protein